MSVMLRKLIFSLIFLSVAASALSDTDTASTRKRKFTRSTSSTTEAVILPESAVDNNQTEFSSSDSLVTEEPTTIETPSISIEIVTKKSLRTRNCGERIGDDVPFIALLVHTNPYDTSSRKRTLSKGVLISENFVLTTVSSIYHSESYWTVSSVRLGDFVTWNKYANRDKSFSLEVDVAEIFLHKKRDIALIKLKESVNFSDVIRPACLPQSDNYNFKELQTHLCKRSLHNKSPVDVTMEFASPLTTYDCRKFFSRKRITISQQEFCVWDETGDDCAGDLSTSLFTMHNGRFFIVGLRSYAETDEEDLADTNEYPGIYVKVGSYLDWISAVINADSKKSNVEN